MSIHCPVCDSDKPESAFYARSGRPGEFLSGCRGCRSAYSKARNAITRAKLKQATPADVLAAYDFDAESGSFVKRADGLPAPLNADGYAVLYVAGARVLAHRAAWLMYYGQWPAGEIDHIDHVRHDNRRSNLREVAPGLNARNTSRSARNTSGVVGVSWYAARQKWVAQIGDRLGTGRQTVALGHFDTFEEAVSARKKAEADMGYHVNHGAAQPKETA
jgi:hypothetical protein